MLPAFSFPDARRWETVRYQLLNTRICDLRLRLRGSLVEGCVRRLYGELDRKGLPYRPRVYLTDSWGCPSEVPLIGVPFYLADPYLRRLEQEQTGAVEDRAWSMMLLRHEAGHAINYAYRLWEQPRWAEVFGSFHAPYRDRFRPQPYSRRFVRHLDVPPYGRTYAQKHPDEDFAETFAVWLTPRSGWRHAYRDWPALPKLLYVDTLMRQIAGRRPVRVSGPPLCPAEAINLRLAQFYRRRAA